MADRPSDRAIKQAVTERYGARARHALGAHAALPAGPCCAPAGAEASAQPLAIEGVEGIELRTSAAGDCDGDGCCEPGAVATADGASGGSGEWGAALYSADQLDAVPDAAQLAAAGCGNPIAIAELAPGEAVLDLGSGGGIDCFLAARQVGPDGAVWGLDMTPDMIQLARHNAETVGAANVRFRLGEIEDIPFPEASFDAVISNCVINLSTDKPQVFREAFRVLKPGGRVRVSDIVLTADLPPEQRADLATWAGCVAGALPLEDYLDAVRAAGFVDVRADAGEERRPGIASAYVTAVRPV